MARLSRRLHIAPHVVFVDGLYGSGKTPISKVLDTFERMEHYRLEHHYEYVCAMNYLGKVADDAAEFHMRIMLDVGSYNCAIGREANLRPSDLSCVLNHPRKAEYLARLFMPDGEPAMQRIRDGRPILHQMTHQALGVARPIFRALGERLTFIETSRHPLFMIRHWFHYIGRFGTDPHEFTVCLDAAGGDVPWFAAGWEEEFLASPPMDRVVRSIEFLTELKARSVAHLLPQERQRLLIVPFERFAREPEPYLLSMESLLGSRRTPLTEQVLREENIPRRVSNDSPLHPHWVAEFGQTAIAADSSEEEEGDKVWEIVRREGSGDAVRRLEALCARYEREVLGGVVP